MYYIRLDLDTYYICLDLDTFCLMFNVCPSISELLHFGFMSC